MKYKTIKDFFNYALGDIFVKGFLFISLPLLSRILDPVQYGNLSLINTAIMIVYVFVSLNLQNAVTNRYMISSEGFSNYLFSIICFIIPFQGLLLLTEKLYSGYVSSLLGIKERDFFWVLLICIMLSYVFIYTCYLQASRQSKKYVVFNIFSKLSEIIIIFIFAYSLTENEYMSKIYAQMIVNIILCLYVGYNLWRLSKGTFSSSLLKEALIFSLPLIVHVLSNSLLSQADRLIINKLLGTYSAGIYSFAYNLGMCVIVIIMAWNSSWQPKLYKLIANNDVVTVRKTTYSSSVLVFICCICGMLFSKEMVVFFASEQYYSSIDLLPIIIMGNAVIHMYLVYVNFVFYQKKSILISCATLIALFINIVLNYYMIPVLGIIGSAWATVVAYIVLAILHYFSATYFTKNNIIPLRYLVFYVAGLMLFYPVVVMLNHYDFLYALIIKVFLLLLMMFFIFRSRIIKNLSD
ncbi:oligosaccharide flippase family protein [Erwinia sp. V71]|uniref:oligosaccharide flippase family protein n=1 Tax=Erwinia sp. V71 TaxID=3369424 RepID=UPI003F6010D9